VGEIIIDKEFTIQLSNEELEDALFNKHRHH
jgi:hypothetical protein